MTKLLRIAPIGGQAVEHIRRSVAKPASTSVAYCARAPELVGLPRIVGMLSHDKHRSYIRWLTRDQYFFEQTERVILDELISTKPSEISDYIRYMIVFPPSTDHTCTKVD